MSGVGAGGGDLARYRVTGWPASQVGIASQASWIEPGSAGGGRQSGSWLGGNRGAPDAPTLQVLGRLRRTGSSLDRAVLALGGAGGTVAIADVLRRVVGKSRPQDLGWE